MVKDIRPIDLESSAKQEVVLSSSELKEIPSVPEIQPDKQTSPETVVEQPSTERESGTENEESEVNETPSEAVVTTTHVTAPPPPVKMVDRLEEEIEHILEEDLKELYLSMPPDKQAKFREKGEETRSKIRDLVGSAKVNAKKIFQLIRGWLKIVPGVNRFFLEQEAKIKTDKILFVTEEEKRKQNENV